MKKSLIISLALILAACGSNLQEPEQKSNNTIDAISEVQDDSDTEEVKIGHWNGEDCDSEWYGVDCNSKCDCLHGECNSGLLGDGFCNCDENWSGDRCDTVSDELLCIWNDNQNVGNDYEICEHYVNIGSQLWHRNAPKKGKAFKNTDIFTKEQFLQEVQYYQQAKEKGRVYSTWEIPTYEDWQELLTFVQKKHKEYGAETVYEALIARYSDWEHSAYRYEEVKTKVLDVFGFAAADAPINAYFWGYNEEKEQPYSLFVIDENTKEVFITQDINYIQKVWETENIQLRTINKTYKTGFEWVSEAHQSVRLH